MKHESRPAWEFHRQRGRLSTVARLATVGALAAGALVVASGSASAATLADVNWSVDNNATGATGVTYTWSFTTVTADTIASVTMTVPVGTAGTPTVTSQFGLGAGAVALAGDTVTFTPTTPVAVDAGVPIFLEIGGFTNTDTASPPPVTSTLTTLDGTPATIDTGTSGDVDFGASDTAVTILLGRSLLFTNATPAFTLQPIPGSPAGPVASRDVTLTVQTNAGSGYTLAADLAPNPVFVPEADIAGVAVLPVNEFAATAVLAPAIGSGATLRVPYTAGKFVGYSPDTPQTIVTATAGTDGGFDSLTLTNQIKVDFAQSAQTYLGTIHYTVTPNFTAPV